jgi:4-hydroxybenzoyl-CoA thioesterase
MTVFQFPVRVYIEDTDAGGIVYYVNYLKYMERSRTEFFRSLGYDKPAILEGGLLLVVHSAQINYRRPARLDDQLMVTCQVDKVARSYIEFSQQVICTKELLCEGFIRIACVTSASMKPCAIPTSIHSRFVQYFNTHSNKSS